MPNKYYFGKGETEVKVPKMITDHQVR